MATPKLHPHLPHRWAPTAEVWGKNKSCTFGCESPAVLFRGVYVAALTLTLQLFIGTAQAISFYNCPVVKCVMTALAHCTRINMQGVANDSETKTSLYKRRRSPQSSSLLWRCPSQKWSPTGPRHQPVRIQIGESRAERKLCRRSAHLLCVERCSQILRERRQR